MKKRGFTLVELLVVIAIIAMLLAILMPALGKVRQLAYRMMCGTNLKGLGTAMMVYSNDYDESYPRSGGRYADTWADSLSGTFAWNVAENVIDWANVGNVTITSSWYLLIRYADVSPAQFVCQASDQIKFEFDSDKVSNPALTDLTMLWDFGDPTSTTENPYACVSYCMQNPFFAYSASASGSAGKPIAADRNPWISTVAADKGAFVKAESTAGTAPQLLDEVWDDASADNRKEATSKAHQQEGQNVLFNDGHVSFEKAVTCGLEEDNIYTTWNDKDVTADEDKQVGVPPGTGGRSIGLDETTPYDDPKLSKAENDSFLTL